MYTNHCYDGDFDTQFEKPNFLLFLEHWKV